MAQEQDKFSDIYFFTSSKASPLCPAILRCISNLSFNNSTESIISYKHFRFTFSFPVQQIVNNSFPLLQYIPLEYFTVSIQCGEYTIYETANNNYGFTKMITSVVDGMSPSEPTNEVIKNEKQVGDLHIIKVGKASEGTGGIVEVDEDENQDAYN